MSRLYSQKWRQTSVGAAGAALTKTQTCTTPQQLVVLFASVSVEDAAVTTETNVTLEDSAGTVYARWVFKAAAAEGSEVGGNLVGGVLIPPGLSALLVATAPGGSTKLDSTLAGDWA